MGPDDKPHIDVAAGVLTDSAGRVLITQRPSGADLEGWWEFPGGKLRSGETARQGLDRELREELGIVVESARELIVYGHEYPDKNVRLHVWRVLGYSGDPEGVEGQPLRWVAIADVLHEGLLPADRPIVEALRAAQQS